MLGGHGNLQDSLRIAESRDDFLGVVKIRKGRLGSDCEGLTVIILHAIFYFIIGAIQQVSVSIEQNMETKALDEMTWLLSRSRPCIHWFSQNYICLPNTPLLVN